MEAFSQTKFGYGFKGGVNLAGYHTNQSTSTDRVGLNVGAISRLKFSRTLALQAELLYSQKGGLYSMNYGYSNDLLIVRFQSKLDYISIPIVAQINLLKKLKFEVGPEFGFLINENFELNYPSVIIPVNAKTDFGAIAGFSYEFQNGLFIQPRYSWGLTRLYEGLNYGNSCVSVSVGYYLK